jgi:hypothetical protein
MTSQFVILDHRLSGGEHWDLMLEHGDSLATWQLLSPPAGPESFPIAARRIGNHRKAYLDYEGAVSGNRGEVRRLDRGPVEISKLTDQECIFAAVGRLLRGNFILSRRQTGEWELRHGPIPAPAR